MESLSIIRSCIACDACREVCPTSAISVQEPIYSIESNLCMMCNGYAPTPLCISVCPVDAIVFKDSKQESSKINFKSHRKHSEISF